MSADIVPFPRHHRTEEQLNKFLALRAEAVTRIVQYADVLQRSEQEMPEGFHDGGSDLLTILREGYRRFAEMRAGA